jgi:hypothetical protein
LQIQLQYDQGHDDARNSIYKITNVTGLFGMASRIKFDTLCFNKWSLVDNVSNSI